MKFKSRGERAEKITERPEGVETSLKEFPFKNPLKGGYGNIAMAEVTVKGGGIFVGFHVKF
ncbi:MAG: hypothetical protein V2A66_05040 [Pseudomonadota bacterium]